MIRKNVANQTVYLPQLRLTADGSAVTASASLVVAKDGVEAAAAGTLAHYAGGIWKYTPTQGETNCAIMALVLTATGADTVLLNILTTAANPQDATAFGITNLDAAISSRMATYTQPTGFLTATFPSTVASPTNITSATGVVLASTTHTGAVIPTVTSVTNGVTVATNNDKTGYSLVAGTGLGNQTANITGNLSGSVGSVTGNVGGSVASVTNAVTVGTINANTITAASIAASALNGKGDWNIGKTGYALASNGLASVTAWTVNVTGNISGSVGSVTNRVTANTDQWNGVAVTGMPMPTFTLPTNFSSLFITAGGYVTVNGDAFGNTLIIPNLASQSSVDNLATSVAALPTATQNRDAVVNANPDDPYNASSWIKRVIIGSTAQREVSVTGAHHVAADMHEIQPGVITFNAFDTDAINLNAIDGAVYTAIATRVADEPLAGHTTAGTLGKVLSDAGSGISTLLSRITSSVATMFGDLIAMIQGSGIAPKWSASALSLAPTSTGSVTATVAVPQVLAHTAYNTDEIIVYRGTFWSFQFINLGDLTNLDKIWFTLRKRQNDADSKSVIQIEQTAGLLIANGAVATNPSHGTLTVNGSTITVTVNQQVTQYCEVTNNLNYDIKALTTGGQVRMLTISDQFIVENDVTRRIS